MIISLLIVVMSFLMMELIAWATHKYVMHGFMWYFHKDHHLKDHTNIWERNDIFFFIFALPAVILIYFGYQTGQINDTRLLIGIGITLYGIFYLLVHDLLSHQRLNILTRTNNPYLKALRKAHKIHHKNLGKNDGKNFGFLFTKRSN